jgi:hypothetical protein
VSGLVHSPVQFGVPTPNETWSEWENNALRQQDADPYHDRVDAFWRTMITNQIRDDAASKYDKAPELDFYDFVTNLMVGNGAHFFRSKGAYIRLSCKHVQPQDKIVVFHGTHLPCILIEVKHEPGTDEEATPSRTTSRLTDLLAVRTMCMESWMVRLWVLQDSFSVCKTASARSLTVSYSLVKLISVNCSTDCYVRLLGVLLRSILLLLLMVLMFTLPLLPVLMLTLLLFRRFLLTLMLRLPHGFPLFCKQ